ncbi:MAG TPA: class I SAM-dependent methyltransferase [Thermoanaerobaculia bacterium]
MDRPKYDFSLLYGLWTFGALIILSHAVVNIVALTFWQESFPLDAWSLIAGITTSAVVAFISGLLTIVISWQTSQHFGEESTNTFVSELREALSRTIDSRQELWQSLHELLTSAAQETGSLVLLVVESELLGGSGGSLEKNIGEAIAARFSENKPSLLAIHIPEIILKGPAEAPSIQGGVEDLWRSLAGSYSADIPAEERKAWIIPLLDSTETIGVCLTALPGSGGYKITHALWAKCTRNDAKASELLVFGARSSVDEHFGRTLLERLCSLIQEPVSTYGREVISPVDVLEGRLSGIGITRSIITAHILHGAHIYFNLAPEPTGTFSIRVASEASKSKKKAFSYAGDQFLPPISTNGSHSGSVLNSLLVRSILSLEQSSVWEIGCGPGYVTMLLAKACSKGRIIANDNYERALEIARINVARETNSVDIDFVLGNCLDFQLSTSPNGTSESVTVLPPGRTEKVKVDYIFIELPLLPYFGARRLSICERGYMEETDRAAESFLPKTLSALIASLGHLLGKTDTKVILPVCTADEVELRLVIGELGRLLGQGVAVWIDKQSIAGFVRPLILGKDISDLEAR